MSLLGNSSGASNAVSSAGATGNSWNIGGSLPFSGGSGSYASAYNSALAMNAANYSNIMAGYQNTMANQTSAENAISSGYSSLYNNVISGIQGIQNSNAQAIADQYAQQTGAQNQSLINSGLGNTTIQASVDRGLSLDESKAQTANQNQFAQTQAGYQSQLGLAGLSYQNQAVQQNTGLAQNQLSFMNSVNAGYPNPAAYPAKQATLQGGGASQASYGIGAPDMSTVMPTSMPGYAGGAAAFSSPSGAGYNPALSPSNNYTGYSANAESPYVSSDSLVDNATDYYNTDPDFYSEGDTGYA